MPQSADAVVLQTPFLAPLCGVAVSECAGICRKLSDTQPGGLRSGGVSSSNPPSARTLKLPDMLTDTLSNIANIVGGAIRSLLVSPRPTRSPRGRLSWTLAVPTSTHGLP